MKSLFLLFMARVLIKNGWVYSPAAVFQRRSVLILGDRIEAILPADEPTTASHADVEVIDVGGAHVLPGFVDTHIHLTTLALTRLRCDLSGVRSARELCDVLSTWASENDTPTVMGVGWDESGWQDSRYPTRAMLDAIDARRPLLARRICGHMGVANSPLLKRLTPQPDFIDGASGVVRELSLWEAGGLCEPDLDRLGVEIEVAIASLHRLGITGIHDIVEAAKLDHYLRGVNQSKAPLRIDVLLHTDCDRFKDHAARCSHMDRRVFRLAGIKLFLDGSLGGHSAALNMPYADHDGARGTLLMELDALRAILNACYRG
ncbi:MAG: amidohydrolase family protein, partial [Candidatus Krumholzibacteria bacterium]|nr:amidohydrolase family protein [Candidatus Krumholzibacteria bacterium]